jgi:hypothetical protein
MIILVSNIAELQGLFSNKLSKIMDKLAKEYLQELPQFIQQDVYDAYAPTWEGRSGDFGEVKGNYDIIRRGNQYFRQFEIIPNNSEMTFDEETLDHNNVNYSTLFEIINNGWNATKGNPPFGLPQNFQARPFWENFKKHVGETISQRFAKECDNEGIPVMSIGNVIIKQG